MDMGVVGKWLEGEEQEGGPIQGDRDSKALEETGRLKKEEKQVH